MFSTIRVFIRFLAIVVWGVLPNYESLTGFSICPFSASPFWVLSHSNPSIFDGGEIGKPCYLLGMSACQP